MEKIIFRGEELIDRRDDIKFFMNWFKSLPKEILWVYGPKSSGKTTVIEYVVENELYEDFEKEKLKKGFWVKYLNLRRYLITSYNTFLEAFIKPKEGNRKKEERLGARFSVGIIEVKAEILKEVKERKKDLFNVLLAELERVKKKGRQPILIIDEIQTLEDIYINSKRELLKEFLNFCVSLTKEAHISHVVILSSNTVFIDRIYNDSKLKETSSFYKIDHLEREVVYEWLKRERVKDSDIELLWEYLGGSIPRIQRYLRERKDIGDLKEYLDRQAFLAESEVIDFLIREADQREDRIFKEIIKTIVKEGAFYIKEDMKDRNEFIKVVDKWAEKEILFFDPLERRVVGSSRIYEKGLERLLKL